MEKPVEFSFGADDVARAYDQFLVPSLFEPWAADLLSQHGPWAGKKVVDLASGTGVVTEKLVQQVLPGGKVIAIDLNPQMLDCAKQRCANWSEHIEFVAASAESLKPSDQSVDVLVCQQGFQFFPDRGKAAHEMYRVLKPGGKAVVATWCAIGECHIFDCIREVLDSMKETEIATMMTVPFHLTMEQLVAPFEGAGFTDISVSRKEMRLSLQVTKESIADFSYATALRPKLLALSEDRQNEFKENLFQRVQKMHTEHRDCGNMASHILTAKK